MSLRVRRFEDLLSDRVRGRRGAPESERVVDSPHEVGDAYLSTTMGVLVVSHRVVVSGTDS